MSPSDSDRSAGAGGDRHIGPGRGAFEDARKRVHDRNEEARRVAKKQRSEADQREAVARVKRDERDGVYR